MSPELLPGQLAPTVAEGGPGPPPMPKLRRAERSPDPRRWSFVVPPVLAEAIVDSDAFKNHRALVERVEAAAAKLAELRAAHEQALAKDRQAEQAFASKGGRKLPRPTAPAAAEAVEQAERELDLLERQLPKSADALFAEAYPHLEAAAARLERQAHDDDERVEAAILAALAALDERAELDRQARWTEQALWESSIVPFDSRARAAANSPIATELRRTLSELAHEREQRRRRRHERRVQVAMHFHEDRSPRSSDGRSLAARRAEAERAVREAEQAGR